MVISHVWGLFSHPSKELQQISREGETVSHLYANHILLLAAIPVICAFIGTTQFGWQFGGNEVVKLPLYQAAYIALIFYLLMLGAVAFIGKVIHWMARRYESRPSLNRCIVFAGYTATPMFLSGIVALYPMVWLCFLAGVIGLSYCAYLLYLGIPPFLKIDSSEGFIFSSSTLAIGVLVLEGLLAATVLLWAYGSHLL